MVRKTIIISMSQGFHMRPAGILVKELESFSCDVEIILEDQRINARSFIDIICAGIGKGDTVTFECDGMDEEAALEKISELASQNFGIVIEV